MRTTVVVAGLAVALFAASALQATEPAQTEHADDEQTIRAAVEKFSKAYNAGDAKTVASLFDSEGEIVNESGQYVRGLENIEHTFAEIFKQHPKINVDIESIRFVGPATAIEDGMTVVTSSDGLRKERNHYTVVHIKRDGLWRMASARDLPEEPASAEEELEQLAWLIGQWVDESPEAIVATTYRWADDHRAILSEFKMQIGGRKVMSGTQRIAWDPDTQKIHSWIFDSEGGSAEGIWTRNGNQWIVKLTGVTHDGKSASATNVLTRVAKHRVTWKSHDRIVGDEVFPDGKLIVVVKVPPKPAELKAGANATKGASK